MGLCPEPKISDMLCQDAANERKAEIGTHGLGATDPVIAAGPLHRIKTLINHDTNGLVQISRHFLAPRIMAVVGPFGAS